MRPANTEILATIFADQRLGLLMVPRKGLRRDTAKWLRMQRLRQAPSPLCYTVSYHGGGPGCQAGYRTARRLVKHRRGRA